MDLMHVKALSLRAFLQDLPGLIVLAGIYALASGSRMPDFGLHPLVLAFLAFAATNLAIRVLASSRASDARTWAFIAIAALPAGILIASLDDPHLVKRLFTLVALFGIASSLVLWRYGQNFVTLRDTPGETETDWQAFRRDKIIMAARFAALLGLNEWVIRNGDTWTWIAVFAVYTLFVRRVVHLLVR